MGKRLHSYVENWSKDQVEQIGVYLLEWNTNSRTSFVSQAVLHALISTKGAAYLLEVPSMRTQIEAFLAYSERHFQRIDKLCQTSYILEYMSSLMTMMPKEAEEMEIEVKDVNDSLMSSHSAANLSAKDHGLPLDIFGERNYAQENTMGSSMSDSDSDESAFVAKTESFHALESDRDSDEGSKAYTTYETIAKKAPTSKGSGNHRDINKTMQTNKVSKSAKITPVSKSGTKEKAKNSKSSSKKREIR